MYDSNNALSSSNINPQNTKSLETDSDRRDTFVWACLSSTHTGVDHAVVHVRSGSTTLQTALHLASEQNGTGLPIVVTGSRRDVPMLSIRDLMNEWMCLSVSLSLSVSSDFVFYVLLLSARVCEPQVENPWTTTPTKLNETSRISVSTTLLEERTLGLPWHMRIMASCPLRFWGLCC